MVWKKFLYLIIWYILKYSIKIILRLRLDGMDLAKNEWQNSEFHSQE